MAGLENVGAYPAVDTATGAVYVGYEFNWFTNTQPGPCQARPTADILTKAPLRCLPLAPASPCRGPTARVAVPVVSMDQLSVAGNVMLNDFPRVAVSVPAGTVSMVWNDARDHPLGDILLRSFGLGPLAPVQRRPVVLNTDTGGFHFYPAVRTATATGRLDVSWYATRSAGSVDFGVAAALGFPPRRASPPASNVQVTTVNWNAANVVSMIGVFGDYTDNALVATGAPRMWPYPVRGLERWQARRGAAVRGPPAGLTWPCCRVNAERRRSEAIPRGPSYEASVSTETCQSRAAASGSSAYAATPRRVPGWFSPASLQSSK